MGHLLQKERTELDQVCRHLKRNYPGVYFFTDFAAGVDLSDTQRKSMMMQRSDDGNPDLWIIEARQGYYAMCMEFKQTGVTVYTKDRKLKKQPYRRAYTTKKGLFFKSGDHLQDQAKALKKLGSKNVYGCWGLGAERAIKLIDWYLGNEQTGLEF